MASHMRRDYKLTLLYSTCDACGEENRRCVRLPGPSVTDAEEYDLCVECLHEIQAYLSNPQP